MVDRSLLVLEAHRRELGAGAEWRCSGRIQEGSLCQGAEVSVNCGTCGTVDCEPEAVCRAKVTWV